MTLPDSEKFLSELKFKGVFFLVGAALLGIASYYFWGDQRVWRECPRVAFGRVTGGTNTLITSNRGSASSSTNYSYEFEVNGKIYEGHADHEGVKSHHQRVLIQYNPADPTKNYPKDRTVYSAWVYLLAAVVIAIGCIAAVILPIEREKYGLIAAAIGAYVVVGGIGGWMGDQDYAAVVAPHGSGALTSPSDKE